MLNGPSNGMNKIPPHNAEAEESVLGALMIDRDAIFRVTDILSPDDFYRPDNAKLYRAILKLYEKSSAIDIVTLTEELKLNNELEAIGGATRLVDLTSSVPSASHVEEYANIVKKKKMLRDLITASGRISEEAFNPKDDEVEDILDRVEQSIFSISARSNSLKYADLREELAGAYKRIELLNSREGVLRGVGTGFTGLDNILSGLQRTDLVILGARPSVGKTTLAMDVARYAAVEEKRSVLIFSLEMSKDQIVDRIISAESQVALWKMRNGKLKDDLDYQMIQAAMSALSDVKLFIEDSPHPSILQMKSIARRIEKEHSLDLIVVDYLGLIRAQTKSDNVVQQVSEISRGLKIMAKELNVPVLALAQLNRGIESRDSRIPRLSDLRDSGSIEQDADVVMFIYRKDQGQANPDPEDKNMAEIIVAKHRNGPLGTVALKFAPDQVSFKNIDTYHHES